MALNQMQIKLAHLLVEKEKKGYTHKTMADELGVSSKTIQRAVKNPEVIDLYNKLVAERLDLMLGAVVDATDMALNSKSPTEKLKGAESFFKFQDKMERIAKGNEISREQQLIEHTLSLYVEMFKDVLPVADILDISLGRIQHHVIEYGYKEKVDLKKLEEDYEEIMASKIPHYNSAAEIIEEEKTEEIE